MMMGVNSSPGRQTQSNPGSPGLASADLPPGFPPHLATFLEMLSQGGLGPIQIPLPGRSGGMLHKRVLRP
jgi:hypothetical protein